MIIIKYFHRYLRINVLARNKNFIIDFLHSRNIRRIRISGDEAIFCCPFHGDSNPSMSMNIKSGLYNCFSCGEKGSIISFISKIDSISKEDAIKSLGDLTSKDIALLNLKNELDELLTREEVIKGAKPLCFENEILNSYKYDNYDYMLKRRFNLQTLKEFEIGFVDDKVTIPVRDEGNNLIAVLGRSVDPNCRAKYMPIVPEKGYEKSKILFGLNKVSRDEKTVILVEGPLDAMMCFQLGHPAVAIQGSSLSSYQAKILVRRFDKIIICTDNDKTGHIAAKKIVDVLKYQVKCYYFKYTSDDIKDPGGMTKEQIEWGIKHMGIIV